MNKFIAISPSEQTNQKQTRDFPIYVIWFCIVDIIVHINMSFCHAEQKCTRSTHTHKHIDWIHTHSNKQIMPTNRLKLYLHVFYYRMWIRCWNAWKACRTIQSPPSWSTYRHWTLNAWYGTVHLFFRLKLSWPWRINCTPFYGFEYWSGLKHRS